jgi:hypothetical protein
MCLTAATSFSTSIIFHIPSNKASISLPPVHQAVFHCL